MQQILWRLAGVDPILMRTMPQAEQNYATVLGLLNILSAIVVFLLAYDAFSYMIHGIGKMMFALLISFLLTLLNVAILQKSWQSKGNSVRAIIGRLMIAFLLAFALGGFALLSIFESNIVGVMKTWHQKANAPLYAKVEREAETQKAQMLLPLQERVKRLQESVKQKEIFVQRYSVNETESNLSNITSALDTIGRQIHNQQQEIAQFQAEVKEARRDYQRVQRQMDCEMNGLGSVIFDNETLHCGTVPGIGSRVRELNASLARQMQSVALLKEDLQHAEEKYRNFTQQKQALMEQKVKLTAIRSKLFEYKRSIPLLQREIQSTTSALYRARQNFMQWRERKRKEIKSDPSYVPYRDDAIMRFRALLTLFRDPQDGEAIIWMSLVVMTMIVLFEIISVFVKVFYRQESLYTQKIVRVYRILSEQS